MNTRQTPHSFSSSLLAKGKWWTAQETQRDRVSAVAVPQRSQLVGTECVIWNPVWLISRQQWCRVGATFRPFGVKTISLCYCIHVLTLKNWIQSRVYTEQMKTQTHPVCRRLCLVSLTMFEFCSACFVLVNEVIYSYFFPFMCKYIYFWCEVNIWIVNVCTDVCGMYFR